LAVLALLAASPEATAEYTERNGFVTLQFDDSHDLHYTHIYPLLEAHHFKGTFAYVTEASQLGIEHQAWKMQEIYNSGHEVQDHTTRHDYLWATHVDTVDDGQTDWIEYTFAGLATWDSLCCRSLYILDSLGIEVVGWNQPGGSGGCGSIPGHPEWKWLGAAGWGNDSLCELISSRYPYARVNGVYQNTAHVNLRGHNCPDRFPFFNTPNTTVDGRSLEAIKTGIADAVASGLWYLALSHASDLEQVAKIESLVEWLDSNDVEVITCNEARLRIQYGQPDPIANQIPEAKMLCDKDCNCKPDGFIGACRWDTTTVAPVENAMCMRFCSSAHFYCYGPETGTNAFSVYLRSARGCSDIATIIWAKLGFDWEYLEERWVSVEVGTTWTKVDTLTHPGLLIDVEDEVDRLKFVLRTSGSDSMLAAYPELLLAASAGAPARAGVLRGPPGLRIIPNPVRADEHVRIMSCNTIAVYNALGRHLFDTGPGECRSEVILGPFSLGPGVFFVTDSSDDNRTGKIIVYR
jgi:hypothetical protein